jgi:hypothetical protein
LSTFVAFTLAGLDLLDLGRELFLLGRDLADAGGVSVNPVLDDAELSRELRMCFLNGCGES